MRLLPPNVELETKPVLKKAASAHRYLAELKGMAATIPNENILINTLALQEAKDSSEIENIITTHDELFKTDIFADYLQSPRAREVSNYATALREGFMRVRDTKLLTTNTIAEIQKAVEQNNAGFRTLPGTTLKNPRTQEIVYTPPPPNEITDLMSNLERYINDEGVSDVDPLIKMAIIHLQFERIHPFYDGNGRTGRIVNILYLVSKGLLDLPVLYLSRYIIGHKDEYYQLLRDTSESYGYETWLMYVLDGIEQTAIQGVRSIEQMRQLMLKAKHEIRGKLPKIYSQDLINNLFSHPYTKISSLQSDLQVSRITATKYLEQLTNHGFAKKHKIGRNNYYINEPLLQLFSDIESPQA